MTDIWTMRDIIHTCHLCASQGLVTRVFATVSGWVICPHCDLRTPPTPKITGTTHLDALIIDLPTQQTKEKQ